MRDEILFKLKPDFQQEIFKRVIKKYGSSLKAEKILSIKASTIRGYKNLYFNIVPKKILDKLISKSIIGIEEIKINKISQFYKKEQIKNSMEIGRKIIKDKFEKIKNETPKFKDIRIDESLDFYKWFIHYKKLLNIPFRKLKVEEFDNYITLKYENYTKNKFNNFQVKIPKKFKIDEEFIYFFGLWCGDRAGNRFGICNQNKEILDFTEQFLVNNMQNVEKMLCISEGIKIPNIKYNKKFIIKNDKKGWALSVYSNNGVLFSFFCYLQENLEEFLQIIKDKNIFFAGLFDAEGNVSLYNKSFRWACKNEKLIRIYRDFLKKSDLYDGYDGGSLITYNQKEFFEKIYPYLKHYEKINNTLFLYKGEGNLPPEYFNVLNYVKNHPKLTAKQIAKGLKKTKVYQELKMLSDFGFVAYKDYPYQFEITQKALISLGASKL